MAYTVLIVDDSKLARMSIAKSLRALHPDWVQLEASNAEEAITCVRASSIDITLLDFNMPGQDGLTLAVELRELQPSMPVAVISANHQTEIVARARAAGASFLGKPVSAQALGDFLGEAVDRLKAAQR